MSSVEARSFRGEQPLAHSSKPATGARKKKNVTWDDEEVGYYPCDGVDVCDESMEDRSCLSVNVGGGGAPQATGNANAGRGSTQNSLDHLRVPSTRLGNAASIRLGTAYASLGQGSLHSATAANLGRRRYGERGLPGGAVRVRTPAKPKRPRQDLTISATAAVTAPSGPSPSARGKGHHEEASRDVSPTPHPFLRRGGRFTSSATSPKVASPKASPARSAWRTDSDVTSTATAVAGAPSGKKSSPLRMPSRSQLKPPQRRLSSAGQALRNVAGGHDEGEALDGVHEEDNEAIAEDEVSPMSQLSTTMLSVGLAGTESINSSSLNMTESPIALQHSEAMDALAVDSFPRDAGVGDGMGQPEIDNDEFPLEARQSLDSRLAAASSDLVAAHRASMDSFHAAASLQGSPYRTNTTTVRRTSTSFIHLNGEPTSVVEEEVSEESSFIVSTSCTCQHHDGCAVAALGGPLQERGGNAGSIEVRDRLEELQRRNSELEQEKVNLTMALVPLDERLKSKERVWEAEREELVSKNEESQRSVKAAEERCRELEKRRSEMEEERHGLDSEIRRLKGEIEQRESKTAESFWQRTVAADREKIRLESELDQAQAKVVALTNEKTELEGRVLPVQSELDSLRGRFSEAEKVVSRVLTAEESLRFSQVQLEVMKVEFAATSAHLAAVQTELAQQKASARKLLEERERKADDDRESLRREMQRLQETICNQSDRLEAARRLEQAPAIGSGKEMVVATDGGAALVSSEAARIRQQELASLRMELERERARANSLQQLLEAGEEERRRMHNAIQDLKGSVRVYVRARPFLKSDGEDPRDRDVNVVRCGSDGCSVAVIPPDAPNRGISCAFDHVFGGHASQEDVFREVSSFVQSALDGFKVCLFSYGQTGSGKTHTMTGSGTGMMRGIVPRAVEHILARVGELQDGPWSYTVEASFLEIYNENLRDLLAGGGEGGGRAGNVSTRSGDGASTSGLTLGIKKTADGGTEVVGLNKIAIDTGDQKKGLVELENIMSVAQRARSVASTAMNAQSSRSHSVFTLWLTGYDASTGTALKGVLHLVDLAGSERLDRSCVGADARRLRETQSINKSLSCLADVFTALSAKSPHVPFRNSKLTFLMQDCLSGDGKALMFVNVSPTVASANETVCSLRFARQVSQVELGKAMRQLCLGQATGLRSGRPPPGGKSPTRPAASRAARASGSGGSASSVSTAPPSPRTSVGSTSGGRNFGGRRMSNGGSKLPSTNVGSISAKSKRGGTPGAGVASRTRMSSSTGIPGSLGAKSRGTARGAPLARVPGRSSVSGSRLPLPKATRVPRMSGEGLGQKGGGSRVMERPPGGRKSFSGVARPSSAIAKSVPPSPKRDPDEKRLRSSPS